MMNEQTVSEVPLVLQQLVCSVCGHPLRKLEWDIIECCPNVCQSSYLVTQEEFDRSNMTPKEIELV